MLTNRFFESGTAYKLCSFQVSEGGEWAPPSGTVLVHTEPITGEGGTVIDGFWIWALVPGSKMTEVLNDA